MNFRIFESVNELVRAVAGSIVRSIEDRDRSVVTLSGGSTPAPIYELLGGEYRSRLEGKTVVWVTGDERDVPSGDVSSNRTMIERTLFAGGLPERQTFLYFDTNLGDRELTSSRFEQQWRDLGLDRPTLTILGIGDDGHTASLFPGTSALAVSDRIAVANHVPQLDSWRYTLTFPVIQASEEIFVLAAGEKKKAMIDRIEAGEGFPIAEALKGEGRRWWFVDRAARSQTSIQRGMPASGEQAKRGGEGE